MDMRHELEANEKPSVAYPERLSAVGITLLDWTPVRNRVAMRGSPVTIDGPLVAGKPPAAS